MLPARPTNVGFEAVTKRFGPVLANDAVTCQVVPGCIHAFLGENGAGKSTLMKMLSGFYAPDSGRILLNSRPTIFRSPAHARKAGIGMVHQHSDLVPTMTVLDNILLGDARLRFFVGRKALGDLVDHKARAYGFAFDLHAPVWRLSVSDRQKVDVFRLLWHEADVLILDEPTSQLAPYEAEEILGIISGLAAKGKTVLLISHHIEEVLHVASTITVLRKGRCIATLDTPSVTADALARMMVGSLNCQPIPRQLHTPTHPVLTLKKVSVSASAEHGALKDVTIDINKGQVLGVAGVNGSGQNELVAVLTGHLRPDRGSLEIDGTRQSWKALARICASTGHIPTDPKINASVQGLTLLENLFLRDVFQPRFSFGPFLHSAEMKRECAERLQRFNVQPNDPNTLCSTLSGGNLQRLILGRELAFNSPVLVAVNPTAGLDIAGTTAVRQQLREHANNGNAVVLVSSDLEELLAVSDRVAVLCRGEIAGVDSAAQLDQETIGLLMGGIRLDVARLLRDVHKGILTDSTLRAREPLQQLLNSRDWWQRRLAAQVGLRLFQKEDGDLLARHLRSETHGEVAAWIVINLARLDGDQYRETLLSYFRRAPASFLEVQRKLLHAEDYKSMASTLREQSNGERSLWQETLATLCLEHLATAPSRCPPVVGPGSDGAPKGAAFVPARRHVTR